MKKEEIIIGAKSKVVEYLKENFKPQSTGLFLGECKGFEIDSLSFEEQIDKQIEKNNGICQLFYMVSDYKDANKKN